MSKAFLGSERLRLTSPQPEVVFLFRISQPKPGTDSGEEIKVCPHIPEGKFSQVSHVFFFNNNKSYISLSLLSENTALEVAAGCRQTDRCTGQLRQTEESCTAS